MRAATQIAEHWRVTLGRRKIRILVVDDFEPWRDFACSTVKKVPSLELVAQVSDGLEAVQKSKELQPDLILLDIGLPLLNGIKAALRIRDVSPASKIVFVTENHDRDIAEEAFRTGATGYVIKSTAARELLPALDAVLHGDRFVSAALAGGDLISLTDRISRARRHQLDFYKGDSQFVDGFAISVVEAIRIGNAIVIIASASHLAGIRQRLRSDGVDVDAAVELKSYISLQLTDSLSTVDEHTAGRSIDSSLSLIPEMVLAAKREHFRVSVS